MEDQVTARELLLLLAVSTMVICMAVGVVTFYVRKNIMLCAEWLVMFCSGCNVIAWFFTGNDWQWSLIWYLDAFSRIAGMNLLLYAGFATLTHRFLGHFAYPNSHQATDLRENFFFFLFKSRFVFKRLKKRPVA